MAVSVSFYLFSLFVVFRCRVSSVIFSHYLLMITAFSGMTPCCLASYPLHNIYYHSLPSKCFGPPFYGPQPPIGPIGVSFPHLLYPYAYLRLHTLLAFRHRNYQLSAKHRCLSTLQGISSQNAAVFMFAAATMANLCSVRFAVHVSFYISCRASVAAMVRWKIQDLFADGSVVRVKSHSAAVFGFMISPLKD
jgi:hypothetical protein